MAREIPSLAPSLLEGGGIFLYGVCAGLVFSKGSHSEGVSEFSGKYSIDVFTHVFSFFLALRWAFCLSLSPPVSFMKGLFWVSL